MTEQPTRVFGHSTLWQILNALPLLLWVGLVLAGAFYLVTIEIDRPMLRILRGGALVLVILVGAYQLLTLMYNAERIELGTTHVRVCTPAVRGLLTLPRLERAEVAYREIASVEWRTQHYSCFGVGWREWEHSLVTRDGRRIALGLETYRTPWILNYTAAEEIAARAGVPLIDRGHVYMGGVVTSVLRGTPAWDAALMSEAEVKRFAMRTVMIVGAIFAVGLILGLLIEFKLI